MTTADEPITSARAPSAPKRDRGRMLAGQPLAVWLALLTVYVVWGSTYLAIRVAVETLPPFLMAAVRFLSAGLILAAVCVGRDPGAVRWPTRREWLDLTLVGGLLLVGGNGLVSWGEQTVASGIAALLVGSVPIWIAIVAWLVARERQPRAVAVGVVVGLAGVAILAAPGTDVQGMGGPGLVALLAAAVFWSIGSVYASRHESRVSPALLGTALEMLAAGLLLAVVGLASGEAGAIGAPSAASIGGTVYLIVLGSLVGYTTYAWLLRNAPLPLVSTYAYVNPVVAVGLGALLVAEPIEPRTLLAGAVIVFAVALIITARGRAAQSIAGEAAAEAADAERAAA